ncbi:hypothetical protein SK128_005672, partial [Halocaridina rubra]
VRVMERRLEWSASSGGDGGGGGGGGVIGAGGAGRVESMDESQDIQVEIVEKEAVINTLSSQVEEQRQLRLQDAKKVEAKAAKIKEW